MTFTFKLARRIARLRAPLAAAAVLTLAGCDSDNSFSPEQPAALDPGSPTTPAAFAGGIPIGFFAHPTTMFNDRYNGGHQVISENALLKELTEIKSRGGRVALSLAGSPKYYLENGHFSFTKWKERINRYRGINFSSFIADGTVIGHFMIDEPNDPANWNGQAVSPAMLEEMGKYSKQLWPEMPTIIRVEPNYLGMNHKYVDAAWAQYLYRRGDVDEYIRRNVADAQERGLALVVGMNVLKGGNPSGTRMSASEVQSWGSALLSSTYHALSSAGSTTRISSPAAAWVPRWMSCAARRRTGAPGAAGARQGALRRRPRRLRRTRIPSRNPIPSRPRRPRA